MRERSYQESADFLAEFFGATTEHAVELRSFANRSGDGPTRPLFTRDMDMITAHCSRWDGDGRGMFFGVCTRITGSHTGRRVDLAECPALWVDIDTMKMGLDKEAVVAALRPLPFPPSVIVDSGGGLHAYWLLNEAIDVSADAADAETTEEAITSACRQLAGICAGDLNVCDLARVMRLPGTLNTKPEVVGAHDGVPAEARVLEATWARHEFDDLVEWLDWQRPVVERPASIGGEPEAKEDNPYLAVARRQGFKPPLDVEQALAAMTHLGEGDTSIHQTQLRVSASLASQDVDEDEIVALLLDATRAAAGLHGATWNWKREEAAIRRMIVSAREKFGSGARDRVVSLAKAREERAAVKATATGDGAAIQPDPAKKTTRAGVPLIAKVGEAAIAHWVDHRGQLMLTQGQAWTYADGFWRVFDDELEHIMRVTIQGVVRAMGQKTSQNLLNAAWRYVMEHPGLLREGIEWDSAGVIVCRNGAIDPRTRKVRGHSETDYATCRIEADIDAAATCPIWMGFLEGAFGNIEEAERRAVIGTLAEWFGSALVRGKNREMTKGLIAYGPSRTGKTQVAQVLRALIGGNATGMRARDLEEHFGMQPLIRASAWIADDAVSSGEFLDAERYKVIVTGEPVSIPRKNKDNWEGCLDIAVCLTANHLPRVKDQSHAVYNRSIVLPMTVEHAETAAEEKSISERVIETELGGVLNWTLEGYARLAQRRYFEPPKVMRDAVGMFEHDNNPIGAWLATAVAPSDGMMVDRRDLLASLNGWMISEFGQDAKPFGGRTVFPAIPRVMAQVAEAAEAFESRWTLNALKRVDADLHQLFNEQQDLYHEALITGSDHEVEEQAAAMCRGWAAIARAMETAGADDDAYLLGFHGGTGTRVAIGEQKHAIVRVREIHGDKVVWITPDGGGGAGRRHGTAQGRERRLSRCRGHQPLPRRTGTGGRVTAGTWAAAMPHSSGRRRCSWQSSVAALTTTPRSMEIIMASTTLIHPAADASAATVLAPANDRLGTVLALDLGTTTVWALRLSDDTIASGTMAFRPGRYEGGGMRYLRFRSWLDELLHQAQQLSAIYFEEVRRHAGTDAAHIHGGFLAHLTAWCEHRSLPYQGVPVGIIKRHVTGKGNAGKDAVIAGGQSARLRPRRRQRGGRHRRPALGHREQGRGPMNGEMMLQHAAGVLENRRRQYGEATALFDHIAQRWSLVLGAKVTPAQVALCMIDLKLARLAHDPGHLDSIVDVAGYAACLREVSR